MKSTLLSAVLTICFFTNTQAQIDIATARGMALGSTVTITGIVTNGDEFGVIRYLEDLTGGIAVYDNALSAVNRGDSLTLTGDLTDFNNLLEMDAASHTVLSTGNPLPSPKLITPFAMSESDESELVQVDNIVFDNGGATFSGSTNYSFTAGGETGEVRITAGTDIEGTLIPVSAVSVVALLSQFSTTYQLLPRDLNDFTQSGVIYLTSSFDVSAITTNSVDLDWSTNIAADATIKYGLTSAFELGEVNDPTSAMAHTVSITGLTAATFYYVQAYSVSGNDTAFSATKMVSTESTSSGKVIAVFNNTVDGSAATISPATGMALMQDTIISMINRAQSTIDVCVYNNNNINIVNALNAAHNNGITVRYVSGLSTLNQALTDAPIDPAISVMLGNSDGLMHNKFMVIDVADADNAWVLSGSTNWTTTNLLYDYNNAIMIQDQAIAKAFTLEFEEMFGSTTATSNFLQAKFGAQKTDNTPHEFRVGGEPMEVYFSPSDQTTSKIVSYIGTTDATCEFAILSFTKNEIGTAVAGAHNSVTTGVRGVMENINDQGEEYTFLTGTVGVDLLSHQGVTYDIHHKYVVIDANSSASDPFVLTGSHNWSTSAETRNDENTVIIHNEEIANHFHQEFNQRHCELNPSCNVSIRENAATADLSVYPNPSVGVYKLKFTLKEAGASQIHIHDMLGKVVHTESIDTGIGENEITIRSCLPSGSYILELDVNESRSYTPLIIN